MSYIEFNFHWEDVMHYLSAVALFILILLFSFGCGAENTFRKTIGTTQDENVCFVEATQNGYIILSERQEVLSAKDLVITSLDRNGSVLWEKTYGGSMDDEAYGLVILDNDSYLITATTCSPGSFPSALLICVNDDGEILWERKGDDELKPLLSANANNGDVVLLYEAHLGTSAYPSQILERITPEGNTVWKKNVSLGYFPLRISIYENNIYLIQHELNSQGFYIDVYTMEGNLLSNNHINPYDEGVNIFGQFVNSTYSHDNYVYIAGRTILSAIPWLDEPGIVRLDLEQLIGTTILLPNSASYASVRSIAADDNNLFIALSLPGEEVHSGLTPFTKDGEIVLAALSDNTFAWTSQFPFIDTEHDLGLRVSQSGNCVFSGTTFEYGSGAGDIFFSVLDQNDGSATESSLEMVTYSPNNWAINLDDLSISENIIGLLHTSNDALVVLHSTSNSIDAINSDTASIDVTVLNSEGLLLTSFTLPIDVPLGDGYCDAYTPSSHYLCESVNGGVLYLSTGGILCEFDYSGNVIYESDLGTLGYGMLEVIPYETEYFIKTWAGSDIYNVARDLTVNWRYQLDSDYQWTSMSIDENGTYYVGGLDRGTYYNNTIKVVALYNFQSSSPQWENSYTLNGLRAVDFVDIYIDENNVLLFVNGPKWSPSVDEYCQAVEINKLSGELTESTDFGSSTFVFEEYPNGCILYSPGRSGGFYDTIIDKWIYLKLINSLDFSLTAFDANLNNYYMIGYATDYNNWQNTEHYLVSTDSTCIIDGFAE